MLNREFIPYKHALALKELGFDEPCFGYWNIDPQLKTPAFNMVKPFEHDWCLPAPLYQQAFKFFREKYSLVGTPQYFTAGYYCYTMNDMKDTNESNRLFTEFKTYEETELACLNKLIEIVKQK
jgi:hypothetical protein